MIPRIRELLHSTPFVPLTIRTSDGREYTVPTPDHAAVHPKGSYFFVFGDDESSARITLLHVAAIVEQNGQSR
jgi:hypothetical protein